MIMQILSHISGFEGHFLLQPMQGRIQPVSLGGGVI